MPTLSATERDIAGSAAVGPPAFTGRDSEVAAVAAALADTPAVVVVEGEAGIGKTRLIREYLASPGGRRQKALVASCPPLRRPHTLGPLADALRQAAPDGVRDLRLSALAGALRPLFPEWSADLPPAPEQAQDASVARHRVFAALSGLLRRLGVGLLVAEDVHWADEATGEFLVYLASGQTRPPLSLVVTCRPEDVPAGSPLPRLARLAAGESGLRVTLGPLDAAATAGLVSSMLDGGPVSGEFARFVYERTEGVPLAAEELVRLLADRAYLARRGGAWVRRQVERIGIPATIRDAVLERAGRLGADGQAVLRAAAVLAEPADDALLTAVASIPGGQLDGLYEALGCGLLAEDHRGVVAFRHALAARAVYEAIPAPQRRAMHRRAGEALEAEVPAAATRLARHFGEAGDTGRWRRYAEQAAELALTAGDEAGAAILLHDLIVDAGLHAAEMARLTSMIPLVALGTARLRDLVHALRVALTAGNLTPGEEAELRFQLGRVLLAVEESDAGRGEIEKAVPGLAPASAHAARAMMLLGWLRGARCTAAEHRRWLRRAAEAARSLEPAERLQLLVDRATALLELGEQEGWAEAAQIPGDPAGPADRYQVARGHHNISEMARVWGRYGEARQRQAQAVELADRYGYLRLRCDALAVQAQLDWSTGAWEGLASRVAALADEEDLSPLTYLAAHLVAGLLDAAVGNRDRAGDCLRHVLADALRRGAVQHAGEPAAALARLALADGDPEAALQVTSKPMGIIAHKRTWIWAAELAPARAEALAAAGRYGDAETLVAAFASGLRGRDAPAVKASLVLGRAIVIEARGEHSRAASQFARAATAWDALPRPYDALLARERQGRCLLAAGSVGAGARLLAGTRRGLCELGATLDADRVAGVLRDHGVSVPPVWRGGRRGYGRQLSPREREVVRLVARGHTNTEIATELCRSPNTVAMQVKSALAKLGVSSRTALAVKAVELGIASGSGPDDSDGKQPPEVDGR